MRGIPFMVAAAAIAIAALIFMPADCSDADDGYGTVEADGMYFLVYPSENYAELDHVVTPAENMTVPSTVTYGGTAYNVTDIGDGVFSEDGIVTVTVGENVNYIGDQFASGPDIVSISKAGSASKYSCVDGVLYGVTDSVNTSIIRYPAAKTGTAFEIPKTVTSLVPSVFANCTKLEEITFQDNEVTLYSIPEAAFAGCTSLQKIGYSGDRNHVPSTVIVIESSAFNRCSSLLSFEMPYSLRNIMDSAFFGCSSMTVVDLNTSIAYIGDVAFADCDSLEKFTYDESSFLGVRGYTVIDGVLYRDDVSDPSIACYPAGKTDESFTLPDEVSSISIGAFWGNSHLKTFTVNSRITEISIMAFQGCTALEKVVLSSKVTTIQEMSFAGCTNLSSVEKWDSLSIIGWGSFSKTGFTTLTIPESVTVIGSTSFSGCEKLTYVTIPDTSVTIEEGAFHMDYALGTIEFLGDGMKLESGSLNIGTFDQTATLTVKLIYGASIPDDAVNDEYTTLDIDQEGKHAYPWENLIGVAVCVLILLGIFRIIREV